jgi:glutathione S-transferase
MSHNATGAHAMYVLYHFPYSQHARRVVSLLVEAGLDYELRHVAMDRGEHLSAQYLAINPNHQVPTLVDGDIKIYESNAILRYLCVKHELADWYPADLATRARVEQWLDWNQCRLSPAVVDIVLNSVFLGPSGDRQAIERGQTKLRELMPILEGALKGKNFLAGERPTVADLSLASSIFQLTLANIAPAGENAGSWFRRMNEIEGFQRSLPPR